MPYCNTCGEVLFAATCKCGGKSTQGSAYGLEAAGGMKNTDMVTGQLAAADGYTGLEDGIYAMMGEERPPPPSRGIAEAAAAAGSRSEAVPCTECGKMVEGQAVKADGKVYHTNCFRCLLCAERLTSSYIVRNGHPHCKPCAARTKAPPASSSTTTTTRTVTKTTTPGGAKSTVGGVDEFESNPEFRAKVMATEACAKCGVPVAGAALRHGGALFHAECFTCAKCDQPFSDGSYRGRDGAAYHVACYNELFGEKCAGCQAALSGSFVRVDEKPYHKACFKCTGCAQPISGGFDLRADGPKCASCATRR
ncbi:FHL3 protein [Thecamonas trahens ATCC 50062]|uniref:FHL3 protein n=1 Tax=Thecamonas trahens ATCC 50062 TaxID=461836 RepID=A0A0L0D7C0_THETB|nr:FHL3 protein [Thecamonas trahens ATCC 50062]KNC47986.1 FHL3 protein [Thecamonas trahens ATCC 50062]|eukprot:XP_013759003.1 FHL3 protein [Thecamonas trahens ATCC 50062]